MTVSSIRAWEVLRMYAASGPLKRVLSGTSTAPTRKMADAAMTHSAQFGAHTATRSPVAMPAAISARPASSTASSSAG